MNYTELKTVQCLSNELTLQRIHPDNQVSTHVQHSHPRNTNWLMFVRMRTMYKYSLGKHACSTKSQSVVRWIVCTHWQLTVRAYLERNWYFHFYYIKLFVPKKNYSFQHQFNEIYMIAIDVSFVAICECSIMFVWIANHKNILKLKRKPNVVFSLMNCDRIWTWLKEICQCNEKKAPIYTEFMGEQQTEHSNIILLWRKKNSWNFCAIIRPSSAKVNVSIDFPEMNLWLAGVAFRPTHTRTHTHIVNTCHFSHVKQSLIKYSNTRIVINFIEKNVWDWWRGKGSRISK